MLGFNAAPSFHGGWQLPGKGWKTGTKDPAQPKLALARSRHRRTARRAQTTKPRVYTTARLLCALVFRVSTPVLPCLGNEDRLNLIVRIRQPHFVVAQIRRSTASATLGGNSVLRLDCSLSRSVRGSMRSGSLGSSAARQIHSVRSCGSQAELHVFSRPRSSFHALLFSEMPRSLAASNQGRRFGNAFRPKSS